MAFYAVLGSLLLITAAFAEEEFEFSYDAQDQWPGICVQGNQMRQSPINIVLDDVEMNDDLIPLQLMGWDTGYDGVFRNTGDNVQFDPNTPGLATTRNHLGTYEVLQFHMHWGTMTGMGSEHRIDSDQAELEIHFVQKMQGASDNSAGDYLSVIGVLADVDADAPITGIWEQLNVTAVQPHDSNISVANVIFDQLLPSSLDYYFYEGSLTTPPCSEIVQWFVLKERITVPGAYLDLLRAVQENEEGELITFNFRMAQAIAGRTVSVPTSASPTTRATPFIALLATAFALFKIFC